MVMDEMAKDKIEKPLNLRNIERSSLRKAALKVNELIGFIETRNVTETNMLLISAANVVAILLGYKERERRKKVEPWWKRRIRQQIKQLRQDASKLEMMISGRIARDGITRDLARKYDFSKKGPRAVLEELRQRVTAKAAKLKRHEERTNQYRQNRLFESNQEAS